MVCAGNAAHRPPCLKAIRMHLVSEHITKGPVGIEVFGEPTGREKQKGTGNDSPANREKGFKTEEDDYHPCDEVFFLPGNLRPTHNKQGITNTNPRAL